MTLFQMFNTIKIKFLSLFFLNKYLTILFFFAVLLNLFFIFNEIPPYQFCDENMFITQLKGLENNFTNFFEFRAGGFNYLPLFLFTYFSNSDLLIIGRIFYLVIISSGTVFFIYKISYLLSENIKLSLLSSFLFVFSSYYFAVSRYWYPDHYIYFFSSIFFYYLLKILKNEKVNISDLSFFVFLFAILLSIKYTTILLFPSFGFILYKIIKTNFYVNYNNFIFINLRLLLIFIITISIFNIGIFFNISEFSNDFKFNLNHYGGYSNEFLLDSFLYYFLTLFLMPATFFASPYIFLGLNFLRTRNLLIFSSIVFIILFFLLYLGLNSGLALHRNVSVFIPLIFPLIAIGVHKSLYLLNSNYIKLFSYSYFLIFLSYFIFCYFTSFSNSIKTDSRILAENWIKSNIPLTSSVGTNQFCSGLSPAIDFNNLVYVDKFFEKKLDFYVINSYWGSAISYIYDNKKPLIKIQDQTKIHFHYFNDKNFFSQNNQIFRTGLLDQYSIIKTFNGSGPTIYILKKNTL